MTTPIIIIAIIAIPVPYLNTPIPLSQVCVIPLSNRTGVQGSYHTHRSSITISTITIDTNITSITIVTSITLVSAVEYHSHHNLYPPGIVARGFSSLVSPSLLVVFKLYTLW